jgi:tetratricopeptide (TPR) repeat protein
MKRPFLTIYAVLLAGASGRAEPGPDTVSPDRLMSAAVVAYRTGRFSEALTDMTTVLDLDPGNASAKNYLWTIARTIREKEGAPPTAREKRKAELLALKRLKERRRRTQYVIVALRKKYEKSRNLRSPGDILAGLTGLDRYLGMDFAEERERQQAQISFHRILANLNEALSRKVFASKKDQLRAEGYLAYYGQDWKTASEKWSAALAEDPSDAAVRSDLASLQALVKKRQEEIKIQDLLRKAETFEAGGYLDDAIRAWEGVVKMDPTRSGAKEKLAVLKVTAEKDHLQKRLKEMTDEGMDLYRNGNLVPAMQTLLEVLRLDPSFEQARVLLSHLGKKLGEIPVAKPSAKGSPGPTPRPAEAPTRNLEKAQIMYQEGLALYSQDNIQEAIRAWEQALVLNPDFANAREALRQAKAEIAFR